MEARGFYSYAQYLMGEVDKKMSIVMARFKATDALSTEGVPNA
jgi:hypothetical protein